MKLTAKIDIAAKILLAEIAIDGFFELRAKAVDNAPTLHAAKKAALLEEGASKFQSEIEARGISPDEFAVLIMTKSHEARDRLLELEKVRQAAKLHLRSLTTEQAIDGFVAKFGGARGELR